MKRRALIGICCAAATIALAAVALGYFSSSGAGYASATVGTLPAPAITGTTPGAGTVALTWSSVTPPAGGTVSYYVTRAGGTVGGTCPSSTGTATTSLSCTDSGLAKGTYNYTVTAVWQSWTAVSGQAGATLASGAPTKLAFTAQPASSQNIQAKGTGTFAVSVAVQDANGNTVTSDNSTAVTLAIGTNPGGGTLTCTNTGGLGPVTASGGVASFTGCAITKSGSGYTLTATSSPSRTAPSNANSFNITAGSASNLAFTAQPASGQNIQATGTGSFAVSVAVQDANGNTVTSDNSTAVTLAIGTNPGGGTLTCTNTGGLGPVTASGGVASFTGCAITKSGSGYTLTATSSPSRTAPSNANSFNITAGSASNLAFTAQPASGQNIQATGTGSFAVSVAVQDANGNTVTSDNSTAVTLAIGTNPGGGTLTCTNTGGLGPVTASGGVASFTGCAITKSGSGYTLTATSSPSRTAPSNANSFNITAGSASNLAFTAQPASGQNIQATGTGSFAVSVAVQDANGNTVTSDNSTAVTLAIGTNPGGGTLTCTNTGGLGPVTASGGVASFTGCAITKSGSGYTLTATSSPSRTAPSNANAFNITGGTAVAAAVTASPTSAIASTTTNIQLSLQLQDSDGNSTTSSGTTTLTLSTSSANGFFATSSGVAGSATLAVTFSNGIGTGTAWYGDKSFGTPTITAKNGTSAWGTALPTITASQFVLSAVTTTPTAGATDNLTIKAEDATGAVATNYTGSHNLTFGGASNSPGANTPTVTNGTGTATAFGSATPITFTSGQATVSGSSNGQMTLYDAQTASITVSDGTISNGAGLSVTVGPRAAASLSLSAQSTTPAAGAADNLTITAKDAYGNTATAYTGSKSLTFGGASNSPGNNKPTVTNSSGTARTFGSTTTITFTTGQATVSGSSNGQMILYKAASATITATDGTINSPTGLSVTVSPPPTPSSTQGNYTYVDKTSPTADTIAGANSTLTAGPGETLTSLKLVAKATTGPNAGTSYTSLAAALTGSVAAFSVGSSTANVGYQFYEVDQYGNQSSTAAGPFTFTDSK